MSNRTLAEVFRILSKADANIGLIPQNQISLLNIINIIGNDSQKHFIFGEILSGSRLANGGPERDTKDSKTLATTLTIANNGYYLNGEKFYSTGRVLPITWRLKPYTLRVMWYLPLLIKPQRALR